MGLNKIYWSKFGKRALLAILLQIVLVLFFYFIFWLCEDKTKRPILEDQPQDVLSLDKSFDVNGCSFKLIFIEGGTFSMGATSEQVGAYPDEKPVHSVTIDDYYIGETEVTQELYEAVMGNNPSQFKGDLQRPVEKMSWNSCNEFVQRLNELTGENFCLPTEAQWEYAARGGKNAEGMMYSGNNDIENVGWHKSNANGSTHSVKMKEPNALGLYDMTGNVMEWCQDYFGKYTPDHQDNPVGAPYNYEEKHVIRGGAWCFAAKHCRITNRTGEYPHSLSSASGFRIAMRK